MLISHKYRFIFLKTHKTASTSVEAALEMLCTPEGHRPQHVQAEIRSRYGYVSGRMGGQTPKDFLRAHAGARMIERKVGSEIFAAYRKVYTVRNPYDKVISWFWHVMPDATRRRLASDFDETRRRFSDWLQMRPILPVDLDIHRSTTGFFPADLIRLEHLVEDLRAFGQRIEAEIDPATIPRWKSDAREHRDRAAQDYYDPEIRKIVQRKFQYDFAQFGYAE